MPAPFSTIRLAYRPIGLFGPTRPELSRDDNITARRLLRRLSNGAVIDPAWTQFSFPTGYHYDVLRGLDYLRSAGVPPDARMVEAIELAASKRDAEGRWPLENVHPDQLDAEPGVEEDQPSRWNTLRAVRVLDWYWARG